MIKYRPITEIDYKNWLHVHENEIEEVEEDAYRLNYHLMPPIGWLNDPNGLHEKDGEYRIYYQYDPFDAKGDVKLWGLFTTRDFIHYKDCGPVLFPDCKYDEHGVYSGSAFVKDDEIHYFYTGNIKCFDRSDYDYINAGRVSNTLTVTSKNGKAMSEKKLLLTNKDYPSDMSCHVRDPKVFEYDEKYYMVLGARDKNSKGLALLYTSDDLENWEFKNKITTETSFGYMWECPDMFEINGEWYLTTCPQGVKQDGLNYANVHQACWMKVDADFKNNHFSVKEIHQIDRGTDFYAQQSFEDENGRRIMIGWLGIPDADYTNPTMENGWQHALTIPRELSVRDGKLIQEPIEELKQLRSEDKAVCTFNYGQALIMQNSIYEAEVNFKRCHEMTMTLREGVTLSYKDHILTLNLGVYGSGRTTRKVKLEKLEYLQIFADTTSLEIFVNHGEEVFTTRVYNRNGRILINGECKGVMSVYPLRSFEIKGGNNEE